ncbi:uncharacterized protein LOC128240103 [Mya arenaria]|uniref:uncharacterized protein LOC128240103 n=1 Tax=Mya arenaria TaxID=6604 RepID=UPI0022DFCB5D|nr:uncharacterized protein LOC128240103 [Mya arenaria]
MPCVLCVSEPKDARILPECHHALCEDCLTEYITVCFMANKKTRKKKMKVLKCPQCTTMFQCPASISSIPEWICQLRILASKPSEEIETENVLTEQHGKASTFEEINTTLGPPMYTYIVEDQVSGKTSSKREAIDTTDESHKRCSTHLGRNVEFYCCSHDEFICRICIIREHNHRHCDSIVDLEDAGEIIRKDEIRMAVISDLEAAKEYNTQLINEIDNARKSSGNQRLEIEKTFENHRQKALHFIDLREKACLKTFDEVMDDQSTQLNKTKAELKANLEEIESIAIQLKETIGSDVKRSYLFPTVLKIITKNYQRNVNTRETHFQSTLTKVKIKNVETEILELGCRGVEIDFEKQTLSSFPPVQISPERLLRAISAESYVQTASKSVQGAVSGIHDQNDIVIKQSAEIHQANSEGDVDETTTIEKYKVSGTHDQNDIVVKQSAEILQADSEDVDETTTIDKYKVSGIHDQNDIVNKQSAKIHQADSEDVDETFTIVKYKRTAERDTHTKPQDAKDVGFSLKEALLTRRPYGTPSHNNNNNNINRPVLKHTFSTTLKLPYPQQGWITDVLVLRNGNIVFSETLHNRLMITNQEFSVISDLGMKYPPGQMALRENRSILICQKGTNMIAVFVIDENAALKLKSCMALPWHPKSINSLPNGEALVSMQAPDYEWKVIKMQSYVDDTFKRFKTINISIDDGYSLHVVVSQTGSLLVIQCCESEGVVHGFDLEGNQKFSFECDQPKAAAQDRYGYIYVVEYSGAVHALTQNGTPFGVIQNSNMYRCQRIAYDERNDRLIVTTYKDSTIHTLQIDYKSI